MKKLLQHIRILAVGFCMGTADLIPGVSGGTIAFICGIYDRLLDGIKCFDLKLVRLILRGRFAEAYKRVPVFFFLPLGIGMVLAIFGLSHLLDSLFETHPEKLWSFFFGLILGSILLLYSETRPWGARDWIAFSIAAVITFFFVGIDAIQTPATPAYLFLAGCIAISAMILPGISGSYILVIMGKYQQVLDAVNDRDFAALLAFMAGLVVGVLSLVRIVSWLLHRFRQVTIVTLTGVMAGALRTVWPWKETVLTRVNSSGEVVPALQHNVMPPMSGEIATAFLLLLVGSVVVVGLHRLGRIETSQ